MPHPVLVAKPNPVPLCPSQILPSSKISGICPLPCQSLQVKILLQHSASAQFTRYSKMHTMSIVPAAHNGGCVRGFQEVHEGEDRPQSKLPRVLSAMK